MDDDASAWDDAAGEDAPDSEASRAGTDDEQDAEHRREVLLEESETD